MITTIFFESEEVLKFNEAVPISDFFMIIVGIWMLAYFVNLFLLYKFKRIGKQMEVPYANLKRIYDNSKKELDKAVQDCIDNSWFIKFLL